MSDKMPATKSAGLAGRLSTVALMAGIALILIAGGLAAEVFLPTASEAATTSSTQLLPSTQAGASTSSSSVGEGTSTSTTTSTSTKSEATSSSSTTTTTKSASTQPGTVQILLPADIGNNESLNFTPSNITVVIGVNNTIVWNDLDYVQHTVQSVILPSGAMPWKSGILNEGQTFTVVLTVPGNYKYDCSIHPDWMVGTIRVVQ
jgi:plastocyanin